MHATCGLDAECAVGVLAHAVAIGAGATAIMDLWAAMLRRWFGVSSLDYALLGRWIGHFAQARFTHERIGDAAPIPCERVIGWTTHYAIGVAFAALLLVLAGPDWTRQPTLVPPLVVSSATLVAPFLVMQPSMGAGIAAARTPRPNAARLRSVATHTVYGVGLYISAWIWTVVAR